MIPVFSSLSNLLKTHFVYNDGVVFRLHYRATTLFLLGASILLTCKQYFGDPIECYQDKGELEKITESFCWVHSTFILPEHWDKEVGEEVAHPGIGDTGSSKRPKERVYHSYYQWVALVLLLQAVFFYLPRYLWKSWEKGLMKAYALDLRDPVLPAKTSKESCKLLIEALQFHWGQFNGYFRKYIFCEVLTFINVVGQMYFLNRFLGGIFTDFGVKVLQWDQWNQDYRTDPLVQAFPRMTKCIFHYGASGGGSNKVDALCILPLNILNEKIFIFLWFWMVILACLTALTLAYRVVLCVLPTARYYALMLNAPLASKGALDRLVGACGLGDWFILYQLTKNVDIIHFRSIVSHLDAGMEENRHSGMTTFSRLKDDV